MSTHVLRNRDFGLFLGGRFAGVLAAQMQWVANGWYLYDLSRSSLRWASISSPSTRARRDVWCEPVEVTRLERPLRRLHAFTVTAASGQAGGP